MIITRANINSQRPTTTCCQSVVSDSGNLLFLLDMRCLVILFNIGLVTWVLHTLSKDSTDVVRIVVIKMSMISLEVSKLSSFLAEGILIFFFVW